MPLIQHQVEVVAALQLNFLFRASSRFCGFHPRLSAKFQLAFRRAAVLLLLLYVYY